MRRRRRLELNLSLRKKSSSGSLLLDIGYIRKSRSVAICST